LSELQGYVCPVLHSHAVRASPGARGLLEEDWPSGDHRDYVPACERLDAEARYCITVGVTPPLAAMLADPLLQGRYRRHRALRDLVEREVRGNPDSTRRWTRGASTAPSARPPTTSRAAGRNLLDASRRASAARSSC
jgi:predicted glycosyl hydrolase (DUF1957 family)